MPEYLNSIPRVLNRVCTGPGKPGKSWNFIVAFSRTGVLEKGYWSWKVLEICLTQVQNMKCMADSKEN